MGYATLITFDEPMVWYKVVKRPGLQGKRYRRAKKIQNRRRRQWIKDGMPKMKKSIYLPNGHISMVSQDNDPLSGIVSFEMNISPSTSFDIDDVPSFKRFFMNDVVDHRPIFSDNGWSHVGTN